MTSSTRYAKPPGTFRILVLGDSFVEAMHVPLEATFARVLERELNAAARHAAHRGDERRCERLRHRRRSCCYFEQEGKRYQPDLVVLAFYPGNDVKNNSPTLEDTLKPVYAADGSLQKVMSDQHRKAGARLARPGGALRGLPLLPPGAVAAASAIGAASGAVSDLLTPRRRDAAPQPGGIPVDYGIYAPEPTPEWQEAWRHTEDATRSIAAAVRRERRAICDCDPVVARSGLSAVGGKKSCQRIRRCRGGVGPGCAAAARGIVVRGA